MNNSLKIAVLESIKPDEKRIPLHPSHFKDIQQGKKDKREACRNHCGGRGFKIRCRRYR